MEQTTIIAVIIGLLIIVSGVQAVQLSTLKTTLSSEGYSLKAGSPQRAPSSGGANTGALPSSIKDLPQMVGGC
ncbi:hypothetical protein J4460_01470 [Candidatus Woesearchaeota archaeon]|nr:MAG: hypothetical protein QS99_C0001G0109 [archaeon GW2011_AR4]MBS3129320.1 hypothetical protein [Candidatus Woesearchaeota archaeon]HIH38623.1 hypothetical protein [Candidatus Woesearchaeota archaeon]HIH49438.1 hypothetical protein [Candidatus Woesearchaeota archaeon]HIJ02827.1 hypothetical protein [Candidatus Woesearchaeota archaeon]